MTPEEQLDEARAKETLRRLVDSGQVYCHEDIAALGARLARENWTPPEPVDPDLLAFREWESAQWPAYTCTEAAYLAGARMARAEKLSLLNWLADQRSLEVSWGGDPEENGAWSVYRVTGGLNDREWHLIATGETPLAALKNARSTIAKYQGEA